MDFGRLGMLTRNSKMALQDAKRSNEASSSQRSDHESKLEGIREIAEPRKKRKYSDMDFAAEENKPEQT